VTIDWEAIGTLSYTVGGYDIRTDPLWILIITARQGHMGSVEHMRIEMSDGVVYGPEDIERLAFIPGRRMN